MIILCDSSVTSVASAYNMGFLAVCGADLEQKETGMDRADECHPGFIRLYDYPII